MRIYPYKTKREMVAEWNVKRSLVALLAITVALIATYC